MGGVVSDFGAVFSRWRTWFLMANQDIYMRYRRSLLGPFWISLSMAVLVMGLALLYGRIFGQEFHEYLFWIACSFLTWFLISNLIADGMATAIEAEHQLRSIRIPLPVLAARMVHRNLIIFLHNLVVIVALVALFGMKPSFGMLTSLIGLVVIMAVGFFAALVLGPLCLRFRDITQVVSNALQICFFITPILWQPSQGRVPSVVVQANPFYHLIELVRAPLLGSQPTQLDWAFSGTLLGVLTVMAVLTLGVTRGRVFVWL